MEVRFEKILIPVDFTINTKVAIDKALSLAETEKTIFYLVHVHTNRFGLPGRNKHFKTPFFRRRLSREQNFIESRIQLLKTAIEEKRPNVRVVVHVEMGGSVEPMIIAKAREIMPDLILLAKKSHHYLLPFLNTVVAARIVQQTHLPVLTAKPGSIDNLIRTVVVPIDESFPQRKIDYIQALKRKARMNIMLVAFPESENPDQVPKILIHVYRLLSRDPLNQIFYETISGRNRAKAIISYCKKVAADLLIIAPHTEKKIGWLTTNLSDIIPANSKTQILSV
jgi:nucleotide-binding universal stress UspA family protein